MRRTKLVPYSHNLNQFLTGFSYFLASLLTESRRASVVAGMAFKYFLASLLTESRRAVECGFIQHVADLSSTLRIYPARCGFIQHVADLSSTSALQGWISA